MESASRRLPIGNPVLPDLVAADPTLVQFGDRYWLYATSEQSDPTAQRRTFSAWSSLDLSHWTHAGIILDLADTAWGRDEPWAPDIVQRNGRYYFFYCADSAIGVAVAESPAGPFRDALGKPLVAHCGDLSSIDPMVFTDEDGVPWLFWGAVPGTWMRGKTPVVHEHLFVRQMTTDLMGFAGEALPTVCSRDDRHLEGSYVFRRGDRYHLLFSEGNWSANDGINDYHVETASATSLFGPWTWQEGGPILQSDRELGMVGPGHNSVLHLPWSDTWLIAYHQHAGDTLRHVNLDELCFTGDGLLRPIRQTKAGVAVQRVPVGLSAEDAGPYRGDAGFPLLVHTADAGYIEVQASGVVVGSRMGSGSLRVCGLPRGFHRLVPVLGGRRGSPFDVDIV